MEEGPKLPVYDMPEKDRFARAARDAAHLYQRTGWSSHHGPADRKLLTWNGLSGPATRGVETLRSTVPRQAVESTEDAARVPCNGTCRITQERPTIALMQIRPGERHG